MIYCLLRIVEEEGQHIFMNFARQAREKKRWRKGKHKENRAFVSEGKNGRNLANLLVSGRSQKSCTIIQVSPLKFVYTEPNKKDE